MEIKRPFQIDPDRTLSDIESLYNEGLDGIFFREYALAEEKLNQLFQKDPTHIEALLLLSEFCRSTQITASNPSSNIRVGPAHKRNVD